MRWSQSYIPTLKEAPGDAEIISHKLLVRAGMIRKLTSGVYTWLPLGLRTLNRAANIVRAEMNRAGAQEVLMPMVIPADLWRESGRWDHYGKDLLRLKDRHERDFCLGPTHEEAVTALLRGEVRSYRQLPLNLYQIQTKFRDEIRPRFGLMRGREFLMKDAYSFDRDDAGADVSYRTMFDAYKRIFTRMALRFRPVEADSGAIGGNFSHEFMVLAETGEDTIAYCTQCDWSANVERAAVRAPAADGMAAGGTPCPGSEEVSTPGQHSIEDVCAFLHVPAERLIKTLIYAVDGKAVAVLVRGDREVNEIKLKNLLGADSVEMATPEQVEAWTGAPVGFAGPVGFAARSGGMVVADHGLRGGTDWIVGANKADAHLLHVDLARDAGEPRYADLALITESDVCPRCGGAIGLARGIEVGHVFKLGIKYSKPMNAVFLDENGREQPIVMGCYGIGVSRVVAACIEQNNDEGGIVFPPPLAPLDLEILNLDPKNADVSAKAEEIYRLLGAEGLEILLDDREERPGVKFKDADLLGLPMQLVIGGKSLGRGVIEAKNRKTGEKIELPAAAAEGGFPAAFHAWRATVLAAWGLEACPPF